MIAKKNIDIVFFEIYGAYCAFELSTIKEIVRPSAIFPIPNSLETIVGIINIRGQVIPVLDPYFIFAQEYKIDLQKTKKHILIFDNLENPMGMIVDSVEKVQAVNVNDLEDLEKYNIQNIEQRYITYVIRQLNKQLDLETVFLLNPETLLNDIYSEINKNEIYI
jgi:purine-binding chemotaxis protein CheW